jgi:hypothetical protein
MHHMLLVKLDSFRRLSTRNLTLLHLAEIIVSGWVPLTTFLGPIVASTLRPYERLRVMCFDQLSVHLSLYVDFRSLLVLSLLCQLTDVTPPYALDPNRGVEEVQEVIQPSSDEVVQLSSDEAPTTEIIQAESVHGDLISDADDVFDVPVSEAALRKMYGISYLRTLNRQALYHPRCS